MNPSTDYLNERIGIIEHEGKIKQHDLDVMRARLLLLDFCEWLDIEITISMINRFFVEKGVLFKKCEHKNAVVYKAHGREGYKCPDCGEAMLGAVGKSIPLPK